MEKILESALGDQEEISEIFFATYPGWKMKKLTGKKLGELG